MTISQAFMLIVVSVLSPANLFPFLPLCYVSHWRFSMYSFTFPGSSYAHSHPFHLDTVTHNALHCIIIRDSLRILKIRLMLLKHEFSSKKFSLLLKFIIYSKLFILWILMTGKMVLFRIVRYTHVFIKYLAGFLLAINFFLMNKNFPGFS